MIFPSCQVFAYHFPSILGPTRRQVNAEDTLGPLVETLKQAKLSVPFQGQVSREELLRPFQS